VVARRRSYLRVTLSVGVYDIADVAVLGLPAHVKDLLPDRRSAPVGRLPYRAARMDGCLLALGTTVVPRTALLAYAGCRAFGLLHDRLLDEGLRLAMQVTRLGCRGCRHGSEQRCCYNELLTRAQWRVRVIDVDTPVGLLA
jgi:hypothetical protein